MLWTELKDAYVYGFSLRKFFILKQFLPQVRLHFKRHLERIPAHSTLIVWGMKELPQAILQSCQVIRVEDGFLRSIGLGAAFNPPISWVFDDLGMYFNSQVPSRLEILLNQPSFSATTLMMAERVAQQIVQQKLSKYNLAQTADVIFPCTPQRKILAIGQVEGDASLAYGSAHIKTNQQFLDSVRAQRSEDYIVYRPHPDVSMGWRKDSLNVQQAQRSVNQISTAGDITDWFDWADEVHVMTSLAGFEALLRHKKVVCHGLPFYSGWGLTEDLFKLDRPKRTLTLNELIAGTLIEYPLYRSLLCKHKQWIGVEDAMQELLQLRQKQPKQWLKWLQPLMKY